MSRSVQRVIDAANAFDLTIDVVEFDAGTKTAAQAAAALGCDVSQIVKSLVFLVDSVPVIALVPGDRRLDTDKLKTVHGGVTVERASLHDVRSATGFVAGGTPPFGHTNQLEIFADIGLRRTPKVWAAAGTPHTVFELSVEALDRVSGPLWCDLSET